MPVVIKSALVTFSATQMFDLVADMEAYPEFLEQIAPAELLDPVDVN